MLKKSLILLPIVASLFAMQVANAENRCLRLMDKLVEGDSIDFSWCGLASADIPATVTYLKQHPEIHSADFSYSNRSLADVKKIAEVRSLKTLSMIGTGLDSQSAAVLLKEKHLTSLDISDNETLGDDLVDALANNNTLTTLSMQNVRASDKTAFALQYNSTLTTLNLGYNNLTDQGIKALATVSSIRDLSISDNNATEAGIMAIAKDTSLQAIDLGDMPVSPAIASVLAKNPQLKKLGLYGTTFGDDAAAALAHNSTIQSLDLRGTKITIKGMTSIATLSALEEVNVDRTEVGAGVGQAFANHPRLKALELGYSPISFQDVLAISRLPKLEILSVSGASLDDKAATQLTNLTNLREIWIDAYDMSDAGILKIIQMPKLRVLALNVKIFSDQALQAIADKKLDLAYLGSQVPFIGNKLKLLAAGTKLKALWLLSDSVSDLGVMALAKSSSIEQLDLRLNSEISDIGAQALASDPKLSVLLLDSGDITQEGIDMLQKSDIAFLDAFQFPFFKASAKTSRYIKDKVDQYCNGAHQNRRLCRQYQRMQ